MQINYKLRENVYATYGSVFRFITNLENFEDTHFIGDVVFFFFEKQ